MRIPFTGVGTALITPFTKSGALDEAAIKRLAKRQIDNGVHFLVPCGTTGETPTLSAAERRKVVELVLEAAAGKVPVMAGAGGYDTQDVVHVAKEMASIGVQGLLSVTPYYNKPTPEGLYAHFSKIAEATPLPIVLYNVPGRTGVNMSADTTIRLSELRNIVAIKEQPDLPQMSTIISGAREDFIVLSGDDPVTVAVMAIGGKGVVSVASNEAPSEMAQIVELCEKGDFAAARKLHHWLLPLIQVNFAETNPIPCKTAMAAMGLIEENYRLPMVPPSAATRNKVVQVLQNLKMLGAAARA